MPAKNPAKKSARSRPDRKAGGGPLPPYGPAIWDAARRGDLSEMKAVAAAARKVLYPVRFANTRGEKAEEAKRALAELDQAIAKLEPRG